MKNAERLVSIDFLRGLTVAAMILVNNPGSWDYVYAPLDHAEWNGCTPTDLVFPFFLFIVGLSINFSLSPLKESGENSGKIYFKIVKRALILFGLGLFIAAFPHFELGTLRIPGVLQRIAIVFLVTALVFLNTSRKFQIGFTAFLLLAYWALMTLIPIPGGGNPNLEAATNLGAWLDRFLLDGHLWSHSKTWDPEGLLSTLPAIASGMLGVFAADWLKQPKGGAEKVTWLFIAGTGLIIAGLMWDLAFPINKKLWTSSYVLYTSGLAIHALGISYWFIDVLQVRKFIQPFIFFGSNAISIYVGSELFTKLVDGSNIKNGLYAFFNNDLLGPYNASLILALIWVLLFLMPAWLMYKKKIIIKV